VAQLVEALRYKPEGRGFDSQWWDQDGTQFHPDPASKVSANLYDICHCCVYSEKLLMMDRGTVRNM